MVSIFISGARWAVFLALYLFLTLYHESELLSAPDYGSSRRHNQLAGREPHRISSFAVFLVGVVGSRSSERVVSCSYHYEEIETVLICAAGFSLFRF